MPSTIWSGAISFGLVMIPIRVSAATEDRSVKFRQVHLADMGRIRTRKICELDGKVLAQEDIGNGYELTRDHVVPVTDEELDAMLPTARAIEIVAFVDRASIDPVRIGTSYYLATAEPVATKPYVLLRQALERTAKAAVTKFAWHDRERLGLLSVRGDALVLHALKWPDEVRSPDELAPAEEAGPDEDELARAMELIDSMTTDDISRFRDRYRDALESLIDAKSEHKEPAPAPAGEERAGTGVTDLMAALNASVRKAREARDETGEHADAHEMGPRKKTAGKPPTRRAKPKRT
ncbi:Ku protein [Streptomyces sp. NPDC014646]|uniref:non-homologous end joining protein Ku n=1 Tax=Streptomyces sp. NPDC014646 TaxID=3364877 RepID=UPI0036FA240A